jgi:hypothetical protein
MPNLSLQRSNLTRPDFLKDPELERLWDRVSEAYEWHNIGCRRWSRLFHWIFGIATVASTLIACLSGWTTDAHQWQSWLPNKEITIGALSLVAAVFTAFGAFYGLERKWHANRIARSRLWLLFSDIETGHLPAADISKKLARIIEDEDITFIGESVASVGNEGGPRSVEKATSADVPALKAKS